MDDKSAPAGPVPGTNRIDLLDGLRGFALFGILLANILYWSGLGLESEENIIAIWGKDQTMWQYRFHHFFVDGKFYSLFSMMFGTGFALQIERLTKRGSNGVHIFRRRVGWLALIGYLHAQFLWDGDILLLYAALGFTLPLFSNWGERALIITAGLLIFVIPVTGALAAKSMGLEMGAPLLALAVQMDTMMGLDFENISPVMWLGEGGWEEFMKWNFSGLEYTYSQRLDSWRIPKVLGMMLLGMVIGRRLHDGSIIENRLLLWRVFILTTVIAIPAGYFYAATPDLGQADLPSLIGTVPGAISYAAGFALLWPRFTRLLGLLAPVGRMALTNYLSHSVLCTLIFYGIGFGLIGRLSVLQIYGVAIAIFAAQIIVSRWWLAGHAQGPMEALWRRLTYGPRPAA